MMYNTLIYLHKTIKAASNNNCLTNLETELKAIKVHFNLFTCPTGKTSDSWEWIEDFVFVYHIKSLSKHLRYKYDPPYLRDRISLFCSDEVFLEWQKAN